MQFRRSLFSRVSAAVVAAGLTCTWAMSALSGEGDLSPRTRGLSYQSERGLSVTEAERDQNLERGSQYADDRGRGNALDNQGGPDVFCCVFTDNVPPDSVPYEWIELRDDPSATWLGGLRHFASTDNGYSRQKLYIGFSFPFYGATYDCVRVATNGFLQFTTTGLSPSNACLPSVLVAGPMVAVFWDDLDLLRGGRTDTVVVGYRSFGTYFVVEFDQIGFFSTSCPNVPLKFEAILYPNGNIKLQYNSIPIPTACANSQSIGIQQAGTVGSAALNYVCNTTGLQPANGRAILFWGRGIPNPITNLAGQYVTPNVVLTWADPTQDTQGNPISIDSVQVWAGAISSGQLLATVPGGVQTYTDQSPPMGWRTYSLRAFHGVCFSAAASLIVVVGNPSYLNNFELDSGGWVSSHPGGIWQWGTPTVPTGGPQPHSGTSCWGTTLTGTYPANACEFLDLSLGLTVAGPSATVEFWYWIDCQTTYDGANFKVSTDGGSSWTLVTPQAGYYATAFDTTNVCTPREAGWSRQDSTWRYAVMPIGEFTGQIPIFRFTFGSNASTQYRGFFFDDLLIWGLQPPIGVPRACTNLAASYVAPNVVLTWTDPNQDMTGLPLTPDSVQIWLGTIATGQRIGSVAAGVQTFTHVNAPLGRATYTVRAFAGGNGSAPALVPVLVGNPSYISDFEANDGGWVADPPTGGWEWGAPTYASGPSARSGSNVWGTVLDTTYANNACWTLTLSPELMVQSPWATVEFWRWFSIEWRHDGCNFFVSVNGSTWTLLQPTEGGYTGTTNTVNTNTCNPSLAAWTGTAGNSWTHVTIPIGQFVGQVPQFRFVFGSDSGVTGVGYYFDDMEIWGLRPPTALGGTVRAFLTNLPIAGARVWAEGWPDTARTDSVGFYRLAIDPGTYSVTFDHVHFCDTTHTEVVVAEGVQTTRNAILRRPLAQIGVTSLSLETTMGVDVIDTFGISNTGGQCPLSFEISDTSGWLTVQPTDSSVAPNQNTVITVRATVAGLAVGDYASDLVVRYNAVGSPSNIRVDLYVGPSAMDPSLPLPTEFALYQNYPNPFNAATALRFDVAQQSRVQIAVFNIMGQEVARPVDAVYVPGRYHMLYDASGLPSGMYLVKMTAADYTEIGKMMLLK